MATKPSKKQDGRSSNKPKPTRSSGSYAESLVRKQMKTNLAQEIIEEWALYVEAGSDPTTFANLYLEMMRDPKSDEKRQFCAGFAAFMKIRKWAKVYKVIHPYMRPETQEVLDRPEAEGFYEQFRAMVILQIQDYWDQFVASKLPGGGAPPKEPKDEIEKPIIPSTYPTLALGRLPFSSRANGVLILAGEEAKHAGHDMIGMGDLILGLLRENDSVEAKVLTNLGLKLDDLRKAILEAVDDGKDQKDVDKDQSAPDFSKFTERTCKVISLSMQEAQRLNSEFIGSEHILLGITQEGGGVAAKVLKNLNVDLKRIRQEIEKLITPSTSPILRALQYSSRAKHVIELAREASKKLGHDVISTEHLLLGIIKENDSVAAQVLTNLGLKLEEVHDMVLEVLGAGPGPGK